MTSVGVMSSAVERVERLKDYPGKPAVLAPEVDGVLKHLKETKVLLETAYEQRAEARAETEIKEVVRLSYDIVDVIADSFESESVPKMLKVLLEKLRVRRDELTRKIHSETETTASPKSSTDSPPAGRGEKWGTTFVRNIGNYVSNFNPRTMAAAISGKKQVGNIKAESTTTVSGQKQEGQKQEGNIKVESTTAVSGQKHEGNIKAESTTAISGQKQEGNIKAESRAAVSEQKQEVTITISSEIQEEEETLLDRLKKDLLSEKIEDRHRVVYIVGDSGMGKSTLARKLYNDPEIRKKPFDVCGWVTIGHNFHMKGVLLLLLRQLRDVGGHEQESDLMEMNEMELIVQIFYAVLNRSYLLVLEDVGSINDWESISVTLPLAKSTRVIITTSSHDFLSCDNSHRISGLTRAETLALLNVEASSLGPEIGEAVYNIAGGSPLYTTILGKSLEPEAENPRLIDELASYKDKAGKPQVIDASYRRLAHELKPCFLYLGLFPPGRNIRLEKLYLLLVAENLIPSQEKSLREYLDRIVGLKLVEIEKDDVLVSKTKTGHYASCRLHDRVKEFGISKGSEEEFVQVIDFERLKPDVGPHTRRLAIYMRNYGGDSSVSFKGDASAKKIVSLLVFDAFEGKRGWPSGIGDLAEFIHLRVLNFDEVDFRLRKFPKGLEKLLLLTFLRFRGCFLVELPSSLGSLNQLEALDLLVRDECCVIIPADSDMFGNMKRMVHLYLPRLYESNGKKKLTLQGMVMLETLVNFDTNVFDVCDLSQMKKLKILSTIFYGENPEEMEEVINMLNEREEKLKHLSTEIRRFDCYNRASIPALKKLMKCRFVHSVSIEGEIGELPELEEDGVGCGERSLAEMVLIGSELEDDPMPYFGKFQNLRSLVLVDDAFMGTDILISASLFPKLTTLKLRNLQYLERLTIKEGALPELSSLQIESCGDALELSVPREVYHRLKNEIGGDAYSVVPKPSKFNTTPLIRCDDDVLVQTLAD